VTEEVLREVRKYSETLSQDLLGKIRSDLGKLAYGELVMVFLKSVRGGRFHIDVCREIFSQFNSKGGYPEYERYVTSRFPKESDRKFVKEIYKFYEKIGLGPVNQW